MSFLSFLKHIAIIHGSCWYPTNVYSLFWDPSISQMLTIAFFRLKWLGFKGHLFQNVGLVQSATVQLVKITRIYTSQDNIFLMWHTFCYFKQIFDYQRVGAGSLTYHDSGGHYYCLLTGYIVKLNLLSMRTCDLRTSSSIVLMNDRIKHSKQWYHFC